MPAPPRSLEWTGLLVISALTLLTIWMADLRLTLFGPLLLATVAAWFLLHRDTFASLGLTPAAFAGSLRFWKWPLTAAAITLALIAGPALFSPRTLGRSALYLLGCCLQQLLFQNTVYRALARLYGANPRTHFAAGIIFALFHIPNPILIPATFVWGVASCRLYDRTRSIFFIGLAQWLLSDILYLLTPIALHHGFRVGPGYFAYSTARISDFLMNTILPLVKTV